MFQIPNSLNIDLVKGLSIPRLIFGAQILIDVSDNCQNWVKGERPIEPAGPSEFSLLDPEKSIEN